MNSRLFFPSFQQKQFKVNDDVVINFVIGGQGDPLLLLHGYPQNHVTWHKIAPQLMKHFTVVIPDLRGYGDSSKPKGDKTHKCYSKKEMAQDQLLLMEHLQYPSYFITAHDRGARVAHRMVLDYPQRVKKLVLIDMLPTLFLFNHVDKSIAEGYYHWFFFAQPEDLPERMIGACSQYFIKEELKRWSASGLNAFPPLVIQEYLRCSCTPEAIHAACEDYRAAASIDLVNDEADAHRKITSPLLVLWAKRGLMEKTFNVLKVWRNWAIDVSGKAIDCGHFIPEEAPEEVFQSIYNWLKEGRLL